MKNFFFSINASDRNYFRTVILTVFGTCIWGIPWKNINAQTAIPQLVPAPGNNPSTPEKVELGKLLYFEKSLSADESLSCQSCHNILYDGKHQASGTDSLPRSIGFKGQKGSRNAPTVWNSALRSALFWDGRAESLEQQAKGPILNPVEMALPSPEIAVSRLQKKIGYQVLFQKAFHDSSPGPGSITWDRIVQAIAAFERTLLTPDSKFDQFVKGDPTALTESEKRGWKKFREFSCLGCHGAPTFTSNDYFILFPMANNLELLKRYQFKEDIGRMNATKQFKDRNRWRVPSLRNVGITAPYFHNGAVDDLKTAVKIMGQLQLGRTLDEVDLNDLVAFLHTLTGVPPRISIPKGI